MVAAAWRWAQHLPGLPVESSHAIISAHSALDMRPMEVPGNAVLGWRGGVGGGGARRKVPSAVLFPAGLLGTPALLLSGCVSRHSCACNGHAELPFPWLLWPFSKLVCSLSPHLPPAPPYSLNSASNHFKSPKDSLRRAWRHTPVILSLRRWKQGGKCRASPGYIV